MSSPTRSASTLAARSPQLSRAAPPRPGNWPRQSSPLAPDFGIFDPVAVGLSSAEVVAAVDLCEPDLTETCTLKSGCEMFALEPNCLSVGVEAYFTQPEGSVSHVCLTPQVLGEAEIRLRAGLVSGAVLPDCGSHLTWTGTRWVAAVTNGTFRFPV